MKILERSLNQSREPLIREVCIELDRLIDHQIREVNDSKAQDEAVLQERAAIEKTLIIILRVKKIKSHLHTQ